MERISEAKNLVAKFRTEDQGIVYRTVIAWEVNGSTWSPVILIEAGDYEGDYHVGKATSEKRSDWERLAVVVDKRTVTA